MFLMPNWCLSFKPTAGKWFWRSASHPSRPQESLVNLAKVAKLQRIKLGPPCASPSSALAVSFFQLSRSASKVIPSGVASLSKHETCCPSISRQPKSTTSKARRHWRSQISCCTLHQTWIKKAAKQIKRIALAALEYLQCHFLSVILNQIILLKIES